MASSAQPVDTRPIGDDDEYEYEYSTTETEACRTYYLTLDLSLPDFVHRGLDETPHNRRGGYNVWFNSAFNKSDPNPPTTYIEENGEADDDTPAEREDDEDEEVDPQLADEAAIPPAAIDEPESEELRRIQILDLHSDAPVLSYRNRIFRGTWKRNMGTELILAASEPDVLPALRTLAPGVDLLAASSARVTFTEMDLAPRARADLAASMTEHDKSRAVEKRLQRNGGVYVNVTSDKFGDRVPQACFLEDLTALKRRRGELDEVTILAGEAPLSRVTAVAEMQMRRHQKNVRSKQRYRRARAARDAAAEEAIANGHDPQALKRRGRGPGKKAGRVTEVVFPKGNEEWARPPNLNPYVKDTRYQMVGRMSSEPEGGAGGSGAGGAGGS